MGQISVKTNKETAEKQHLAQVRVQKMQAKNALQQYDSALADLTDNWSSLTSAQKTEAIRTMLVVLARSVRFMMLKFFRV